jgi:hypothetical protein
MSVRLRSTPKTCAWCKRVATHLCDAFVRWINPEGRDELAPCRMPTCDEHTTALEDGADICPKCMKLANAELEAEAA